MLTRGCFVSLNTYSLTFTSSKLLAWSCLFWSPEYRSIFLIFNNIRSHSWTFQAILLFHPIKSWCPRDLAFFFSCTCPILVWGALFFLSECRFYIFYAHVTMGYGYTSLIAIILSVFFFNLKLQHKFPCLPLFKNENSVSFSCNHLITIVWFHI